MGSFLQPTERFSHIHVNLIGPLPIIESYEYCLTIIDRSTRWPDVYPLKNILKESVCTGLINAWVSRFGCADVLKGRQFRSAMFGDFTKIFGVQLRLISSLHPKSNGIIEILHRHLKAAIMAHHDENWLEALPLVLLGIRPCFKEGICKKTITTAGELVYGEPLRLPGEMLKCPSPINGDSTDLLLRMRKIFARLRTVPASKHCEPGVFDFKELADCKHIFLHMGPLLRALQPPYVGPYEVMQRKDKTMNLKIKDKSTSVSIDQVKHAFILPDLPLPTSSQISTTAVSYNL